MAPRLSASSPFPQPGEVIDGKYQVIRTLGQGGMGAVVRAYHLDLQANVALKFMNPDFLEVPGAAERFRKEGIATRAIESDHVVRVFDTGRLPGGAPFLVMDCLEGKDLSQILAEQGKPGLPPARAVHFVLQILRGLQAAHGLGIVHRDMKPANCFVVRRDGEDDFVKLLDFGISKVLLPDNASLTSTQSSLGTPLYMSPEQARSPREVDERSDLYSVGVILYELLSGRTVFNSESGQLTELLFKLFTAEPEPIDGLVADLPEGFAKVVHKALARSPKDRYASALEMAEALEPFADARGALLIAKMRAFVPPDRDERHSRAAALSRPVTAARHHEPPLVFGAHAATETDPVHPTLESAEPPPKGRAESERPGQRPGTERLPERPGPERFANGRPGGTLLLEPQPKLIVPSQPPDTLALGNPSIPRPARLPAMDHVSTPAALAKTAAAPSSEKKANRLLWVIPALVVAGGIGVLAVVRPASESKPGRDRVPPSPSSSVVVVAPPPPPPPPPPSVVASAPASAATVVKIPAKPPPSASPTPEDLRKKALGLGAQP